MDTFTTAVDSRLRWGKENEFSVMAAVVENDSFRTQPLGVTTALSLGKGAWRGNTGVGYKGRDFNINSLGFESYSNVINHWAWLGQSIYPKQSWLNSWHNNFNIWQEMFPDGSHWEKGCNWNGNAQTSGRWSFGGGAGIGRVWMGRGEGVFLRHK